MTSAVSGLSAALFRDEPDDYVVFEEGSNKGMCFVSLGGTPSIEIIVSGLGTELSVSVADDVVTVNSATDGSGNATSTAEDIVDAVNDDASASAIFLARLSPGSTGAGIPGAMTETEAEDGVAFTGITLTDSGDHLTFQAASGSRYWDDEVEAIISDAMSAQGSVYGAWREIQRRAEAKGLRYPALISLYKRAEKHKAHCQRFGVDLGSLVVGA